MAQLEKGILGDLRGSAGNVTGSRWKKTKYIRVKQGKRTGKPSEKQVANMAKFSLVGKFIRAMKKVFRIGFKGYSEDITQHNYAFAYTIEKAVTGTYPDFELIYPKVLVAQGSLTNAESPSAFADGRGKITFKWTDNSDDGTANPQDKAILVAYCEELNQCAYKAPAAGRETSEDSLKASAFSGKKAQTWISFLSAEGEIATSIFTGVVDVV